MDFSYKNRQRLTQKEKDSEDYQWYKDQADLLDASREQSGFGGVSEYKRKKVNYDLFNNIIDLKDFSYVCQPFGAETGELPAQMTNRDIVSGKIKVLLGMEMKMPFSWSVVAVNEEATTRKEQEEARQIREFVVSEVTKPIRMEVEQTLMEQQKGRELTPEEQNEVKQQVETEVKRRTPDEVRRYMTREHQDPAEALAKQILEYLLQAKRIKHKFNKGWKHMNLSGSEVYWVGIRNGEPDMQVVNCLNFDNDLSSDEDFTEDGEWAVCDYYMSPSAIVSAFGDELTDEQIDRLYDRASYSTLRDSDFTFDPNGDTDQIRVTHYNWKSLRKIGFLTYQDRNGEPQEKIVDENYRFNKRKGDLKIEWEWIPESHEVYRILDDMFVYARPVPGQHRDLDKLYECKLSYFGASVDNLNSPITAPMDRMKTYQYFYDIILYRIELLMASDKGKILIGNINSVPKSKGIDINKFMYFLEANKIGWLNPNEEGNKAAGDITNMVKEIDMSLVSDIAKYIDFAEYIERKCGDAIGVTKQVEGSIGPDEAVGNTRQNLVQKSHILQPYFELHNTVKGNALTALLETAKVAWGSGKPRKLSYFLDDMSLQLLTVDPDLLENSTYGLFVANSSKAADAKQAVENLAQAALQTQQADLGDIIKVIRADSIQEAEELLEGAKLRNLEQQQQVEQAKLQAQKESEDRLDAREKVKREHEKEMIILKEKERRKTEIQKQAMFSMGFDPEKDQDGDGEVDVMEVAKFGVEADIKRRQQNLKEQEFLHKQKTDAEKLELDKEKVQVAKMKKNSPK
jgi:hypothetical protein